jgi:SAM-dependent methyltransferase
VSLLDRLAPKKPDAVASPVTAAPAQEPLFSTKALRKFLATMAARDGATLLDVAPVVGSNLNYFGEHFGCKILIEDLYADVERHVREQKLPELAGFLAKRFRYADATVDAVLCWDLMDYLDRPAAQALAEQLTRLLKPEGVLLAFFGTAQPRDAHYTRYIIADDVNLKHRTYPASRGRQAIFANRDIIRLFDRLRVSDSFLLQNNLREILFRKPSYETR